MYTMYSVVLVPALDTHTRLTLSLFFKQLNYDLSCERCFVATGSWTENKQPPCVWFMKSIDLLSTWLNILDLWFKFIPFINTVIKESFLKVLACVRMDNVLLYNTDFED